MEQKLSALIVDDEESARRLMEKIIEETLYFSEIRIAYICRFCFNTEMSQYDPDLVFLDIKMPGRDGFSFINDLKLNYHNPEIVFVTAYDHYAIQAHKDQAFDYLLKPVNRKELKQCIEKYARRQKKFLSC